MPAFEDSHRTSSRSRSHHGKIEDHRDSNETILNAHIAVNQRLINDQLTLDSYRECFHICGARFTLHKIANDYKLPARR